MSEGQKMSEENQKKEMLRFQIERDALLKLKLTDQNLYSFIMSVSESETDYYSTLDKEKLKSECALGYFAISDLFTKEQIKTAHLDQCFGGERTMKPSKVKPCHEATALQEQCAESVDKIAKYTHPVNLLQSKGFDFNTAHKHEALTSAILNKKPIKIKVTPEESELVQKICFALGVRWNDTTSEVINTDCRFLFIDDFACYGYAISPGGNDIVYFDINKNQEYSMELGRFVEGVK